MIGGSFNMDGREEKFAQNFGRKTLRKEATWKNSRMPLKKNLTETGWEVVHWVLYSSGYGHAVYSCEHSNDP